MWLPQNVVMMIKHVKSSQHTIICVVLFQGKDRFVYKVMSHHKNYIKWGHVGSKTIVALFSTYQVYLDIIAIIEYAYNMFLDNHLPSTVGDISQLTKCVFKTQIILLLAFVWLKLVLWYSNHYNDKKLQKYLNTYSCCPKICFGNLKWFIYLHCWLYLHC